MELKDKLRFLNFDIEKLEKTTGISKQELQQIIDGTKSISLLEMNSIVQVTGMSKEFISNDKVINKIDSKIKEDYNNENFKNQKEKFYQEIIRYAQEECGLKRFNLNDMNFLVYNGKDSYVIDVKLLLRCNNVKFIKYISTNFKIYQKENGKEMTWEYVFDHLSGQIGLSNLNLIELCTSGFSYLLSCFQKGKFPFDSRIVLSLINKGGYLYHVTKCNITTYEAEFEKDVFATLLLKEYCERQIKTNINSL